MKNYKSFLSSRTVWFGIIQILYGGVGMILGSVDQGTGMTLITTGISSIGLRMKTSQPIE